MVKVNHGQDRVVYLHGKEMVKETGSPAAPIGSKLTCTCHIYRTTLVNKVPWCDHIKVVYERGLDARDTNQHPIPMPPFVEVVLFTSKPPTLAYVGLDPTNDVGLQKAWIVVNDYTEGAYAQHFIGFLFAGSGRGVLRRMVLDELTGMTYEDAIQAPCLNPAHWKTGLFNKGFDPKDRMQLADILYRIQHQECWTCYTNSGVPEI